MFDNKGLYDSMNIKGSAIIVNQTDYEDREIIQKNNNILKFISSKDRGLSKSRNLAIKNSDADICLFADNDVTYEDNYINIILDAYKKYPDDDIISFTVNSTNIDRTYRVLNNERVNHIMTM